MQPPHPSGYTLQVSSELFDDDQFLLLHTPSVLRRAFGPIELASGRLFSDAPQGATFSFGMGSPAFSSYATSTGQLALATPDLSAAQEADPMINYQLSQIQQLLTQVRRGREHEASTRSTEPSEGVQWD